MTTRTLTDPIARLALGTFFGISGAALLLAGVGESLGAVCSVVGLLLLASQKRTRKPTGEPSHD